MSTNSYKLYKRQILCDSDSGGGGIKPDFHTRVWHFFFLAWLGLYVCCAKGDNGVVAYSHNFISYQKRKPQANRRESKMVV